MTSSLTRPPSEPEATPALTVNKVVAGAGAAATSAVAGSFFGATGTIVGAAVGSIISIVAASLYEYSLDRTRETVHSRIRRLTGRSADPDATQVLPAMRPANGRRDAGYTAPRAPRHRWLMVGAATALVFVLSLLAVTGVELLKGSQLATADEGTSVGSVVSNGQSSAKRSSSAREATTSPKSTTSRTSSSAKATKPIEPTATPMPSNETRSGASPGDSHDKLRTAAETPPASADITTTAEAPPASTDITTTRDMTASGGKG